MADISHSSCLHCGMHVHADTRHCPKCDNPLDLQTDGSTITVDIAHHGERVRDALEKLEQEISHAKRGVAKNLRLIVGSGLIKDEVLSRLLDYEFRKLIRGHGVETHNPGAIMVKLK